MIAMLVAEYGLNREEAYMLCSVAGDLKMHEVVSTTLCSAMYYSELCVEVDMPNYVVSAMSRLAL